MSKKFGRDEKGEFCDVPTVAIVGRPNVGKSSLFNVILGRRLSIVHEESGVTRDTVISPVNWKNHYFQLIDTGGLGLLGTSSTKRTARVDSDGELVTLSVDDEIRRQAEIAIESADLLVHVVDITVGVVPLDEEVSDLLRKSGKPVILVPNKADNAELEGSIDDFNKLAIEDVLPVSSLHRRGIDELCKTFFKYLPKIKEYSETDRLIVAVAGRPNVGKSSIVNNLIGTDRIMVSDVAGTTRDAVDTPFEMKLGDEVIPATLVDTAGLRKRGRASTAVEFFSIMRAKEAIVRSNICFLVIEASEGGATTQDAKIGRIISDSGKACIIVANKYDLCDEIKQKDLEAEIRHSLPFLNYAPIVFTSALTSFNFPKLIAESIEVNQQYKVKIPTSTLNKVISDAMRKNSAPVVKGRFFKVYYATMVSNRPPLFVLFVNSPKLCPANYQAYLRNYLREAFNLPGLPIRIKLKERPKSVQSIRSSK